jgi:hypothetical protein
VLGPDGLSRFEELKRQRPPRQRSSMPSTSSSMMARICAISHSSTARPPWRGEITPADRSATDRTTLRYRPRRCGTSRTPPKTFGFGTRARVEPSGGEATRSSICLCVAFRPSFPRCFAGAFDNLPGAGKPLPNLGQEHDPLWGVKQLVSASRSPCCCHRSNCSAR